jgi:hypothetical protein
VSITFRFAIYRVVEYSRNIQNDAGWECLNQWMNLRVCPFHSFDTGYNDNDGDRQGQDGVTVE